MPPPARPVLLYDDGCRFCRACACLIDRWNRAGCLRLLPWSDPQAAAWLRDLSPAQRDRSMHVRDIQGCLHSGDEAVLQLLEALPGLRGLARAARRFPPLRVLLWRSYAVVARYRRHLSRISPNCASVSDRSHTPVP